MKISGAEAKDTDELATVTILSQIKAVKALLKFAREQSDAIEDYYRHDDRGEVFYHPMNIAAGNCGSSERGGRGDFHLQRCAFALAKNIYYQLYKELWTNNNLLEKLLKIQKEYNNHLFETEADLKAKFESAVPDADGRKCVSSSAIPDRFFPAYLAFGKMLHEVISNLDSIPSDPNIWINELNLMFREHARKLIHQGRITPVHFQTAMISCFEALIPPSDRLNALRESLRQNQITQDRYYRILISQVEEAEKEDCNIDFDYLYQLSDLFSVHSRSVSVRFVNGKAVIQDNVLSAQEIVKELIKYLSTVKHSKLIVLFSEVFGEVYLNEVEYLAAQKNAVKPREDDAQRWNSSQFWGANQRAHQESMQAVFAEIKTVKEADKELPAEDPGNDNKLV